MSAAQVAPALPPRDDRELLHRQRVSDGLATLADFSSEWLYDAASLSSAARLAHLEPACIARNQACCFYPALHRSDFACQTILKLADELRLGPACIARNQVNSSTHSSRFTHRARFWPGARLE